MTKNECDSILRLRDAGNTYAQISEETGIPVNTLKTFFHRSSRKKKSEDEQPRCRECGGIIEQKPKTKKQIFCCGECRQKWWNSHPEAVHRKAVYNYTCPYCGRDFSAYGNAHRKYCSHECYIKDRFKGGGCHE